MPSEQPVTKEIRERSGENGENNPSPRVALMQDATVAESGDGWSERYKGDQMNAEVFDATKKKRHESAEKEGAQNLSRGGKPRWSFLRTVPLQEWCYSAHS